MLLKLKFSVTLLQQAVPRDPPPTMKYYEVLAVVYNIKDEKTAGNLVACINVGETYHQRKEKVTCTQWYLFNDFSILPIEKVSVSIYLLYMLFKGAQWSWPFIDYINLLKKKSSI